MKTIKTKTDLINEIIELKPSYNEIRNILYTTYNKQNLINVLNGLKKKRGESKMKVVISGHSKYTDEELAMYEQYAKEKEPNCVQLDVKFDGDYVDLTYHIQKPFERIRRITGYLVGTTDRWNAAKKAELNERTKHKLEDKNVE